MKTSFHLPSIIMDYFRQQNLHYCIDERLETYNISAGIPHGSVLAFYGTFCMKDILWVQVSNQTVVVGFTDDVRITKWFEGHTD